MIHYERKRYMNKFRWALLSLALTGMLVTAGVSAAGYGSQRAPEMELASTVGCDLDTFPYYNWYFDSKTWSTNTYRASGCGEVTLRWRGWYASNSGNQCANVNARTYNEDGTLKKQSGWRSVCGHVQVTLLTNVSNNRKVRIHIQAQRGADQRMDNPPKESMVWS